MNFNYDALAAYDAALSRLDNEDYKNSFTSFKEGHERHITELSSFLAHKGETVSTGPSAKSYLTQGKVILANLIGDETILRAMSRNEIDTNTAYGKINNYKEIPLEIHKVFKQDCMMKGDLKMVRSSS